MVKRGAMSKAENGVADVTDQSVNGDSTTTGNGVAKNAGKTNGKSEKESMDTNVAEKRSTRKKKMVDYTAAEAIVDDDSPPVKRSRGRQSKNGTASAEEVKNTNKKAAAKKPAAKKDIKNEPDDDDDNDDDVKPNKIAPKGKAKNSKAKVEVKDEAMDVDDSKVKADSNGKKKDAKAKTAVKKEPKSVPVKKQPKSAAVKVERTAIPRQLVKKGLAAVDGLCPIAQDAHVHTEGSGSDVTVWDCMLNQTNIQFNNNKYYLIQLLKDDAKEIYSVWMRWGRVGNNGQNSLVPCGSDVGKAKKVYCKKFSDKTKNDWDERDCFEKVMGKYDLVKLDYSETCDEVDAVVKKEHVAPNVKIESKLELRVKALIELICDIKAMEQTVIEMKYDATKAPLGKLTVEQVKAGYAALKEIDDLIGGSGKSSNKDLVYACNDFYTRVPHYFGMKVPPLITTKSAVIEKMALLQALGDIQAGMNVIQGPSNSSLHPTDSQYERLGCSMEVIAKSDERYKLLSDYMLSTHGKTHSMYSLEIQEIYAISRKVEVDRFKDHGNSTLLWHGSRLTNWAGILSQGLRIAPPEAPCTGYMFGKGLYFADMSSKSANYCMTTKINSVGLLVLCQVSLGWSPNELLQANSHAHRLPSGSYSVKALGRTAPDPLNAKSLSDGTIVPMGPGKDTTVNNTKGYSLQYNEYIVYDPAQVQMKFLFKVKFNYKY